MRSPTFWLCLFLLGSLQLWAQNMNIRTYRVEDGIPQSQVLAVHRDPAGYVWVGTYSGAARYNGQTWKTFDQKDGLAGNHVTCFLTDQRGWLWLGTFGQGISRFDGQKFHNFDANTPEGFNRTYTLLETRKGRVWAGTDRGLLIFRGNHVQRLTTEDGLPDNNVLSLFEDGAGVVYVGTLRGVVAMIDGVVRVLPFSDSLSSYSVSMIREDGDRRLWLGTDRGLFYVEGDQAVRLEHPILSEARVLSASPADDGLWIGTQNKGAFKLVGRSVVRKLNESTGLPNPTINQLLFDREKSLWLGTDSGLSKYRPSAFVSLTRAHGLGNSVARTLHQDNQNRIWVGTRNGVYLVYPDFHVEAFPLNDQLPPRIFSLDIGSDGAVYFASPSGLSVYRDGKVSHYHEGLINTDLRWVLVDRSGHVWVGGIGFYQFVDGRFELAVNTEAIEGTRIFNMVQDEQGLLWLGTGDGVASYDTQTKILHRSDAPHVAIWDVDVDAMGRIWAGTNGDGLWCLDGDRLTRYNSENGLGNDYVWQVLCGRGGEIWAGHNLGIDRIQDGQFQHYSKSDGLAHNEGAATAILEDHLGRVWFGTGEGISIYLPGELNTADYIPRVVVASVDINDHTGSTFSTTLDEPVLENHFNNVAFHFNGLSFIKEEDIEYSFMLEGLEVVWSPPGSRSDIKYVNLSPNEYHFKVKARNQGGEWSSPATFAFKIKPAIYQRLGFRLTLGLLVILGVVAYVRYRVDLMAKQNHELEVLVRQRTEALAQKGREFRELSLSDPLTRVRNRRYVSETMRDEINRLKRRYFRFKDGDTFTCLGVIVIDLDHFKSVNDEYGHDAGDAVLIETSDRLRRAVRNSDVVARWGGEEFLVLLRDIHPDDLPEMADKLLEVVREKEYRVPGGHFLKRTASAGFAYMHPWLVMKEVPWEWTFKLADLALYRAKNSGRNQALGITYNPDKPAETWYMAAQEPPERGLQGDIFTYVSPSDPKMA